MDDNSKHSARILLIVLIILAICIWPYLAWQNHIKKSEDQELEKSGSHLSSTTKSALEQAVISEASQKGVKAGIQVSIIIKHYDGSEAMGEITFASDGYQPKQFIAELQNGKWVITQYATKVNF